MSGPYMPAIVAQTGMIAHAAELPVGPTLCGLKPRWVAPHDRWPGLGPVCGACLAVAQGTADIEQLTRGETP